MTLRILNLGAGVQSTWLYLMAMLGLIEPFDYAICSDTQDESGSEERRRRLPDPEESFYAHLDWLGTQAAYLGSDSPLVASSNHLGSGCPILVRTAGQISADLINGVNVYGEKYSSTIPAYVGGDGEFGMVKRQCTKDYKIRVIEQAIRRDILGLDAGRKVPKDVIVRQYIGISWDERSRAADIARRFETQDTEEITQTGLWEGAETVVSEHTGRRQKANWRVHFPLIEDGRQITRKDCEEKLREHVPHRVYGSACVQCPYKDDATWHRHMQPGPTRELIIQIDHGIRQPGAIVNRNLDQKLYLHRSCKPIDQIDFTKGRQDLWDTGGGLSAECEGGCGL